MKIKNWKYSGKIIILNVKEATVTSEIKITLEMKNWNQDLNSLKENIMWEKWILNEGSQKIRLNILSRKILEKWWAKHQGKDRIILDLF